MSQLSQTRPQGTTGYTGPGHVTPALLVRLVLGFAFMCAVILLLAFMLRADRDRRAWCLAQGFHLYGKYDCYDPAAGEIIKFRGPGIEGHYRVKSPR